MGSVGEGCQFEGDGVPNATVGGTGSAASLPFAPWDCSVVAGDSGSIDHVDCVGGDAVAPGGITGPAATPGADAVSEAATTSTVTGAVHRHRGARSPWRTPVNGHSNSDDRERSSAETP